MDQQEQLSFLKEVDEITKKETLNTQKITKYETLKSKEKIEKEKNKTKILLIVSVLSALGNVFLLIYSRQKNRKLRAAYEKILENLDKKNNPKNDRQIINSDETKEIENEDIIVKQLEILEQKKFFTAQNMSATQMAVLLKITPRNLSYLLKKYRNEDFYNYLNNMRVDYFSKILRDNQKYRNYKIASLSEMVGYNSHSQLTINFKKKTGITPSQYIDLLEKENVSK